MAETPKKRAAAKRAPKKKGDSFPPASGSPAEVEPTGPAETALPEPALQGDEEEDPQYAPAEPLEIIPIVRHEERLQKIIAAAGVTSRRKAEELITEGRVQVNGAIVVELGTKADPALDHIRVNGKLLPKPGQGANRLRYAMLNKPKGYITTASDPEGRPTVMEFFPGSARVYPVGRLDYQSEGLLLMTNDGELANLLTRAANKVAKVYLVKISGKPSDEALNQLRAGIMIDKGRNKDEKLGRVMTQPAGIRRVRDAENPWYEVTLTEGRNREIRKMFEEVGHFVEKIRRVGFGPLVLDIEPGQVRELNPEEILALQRAARGIRTISRLAVPPVSLLPVRKVKRPRIHNPLAATATPASRPILSERKPVSTRSSARPLSPGRPQASPVFNARQKPPRPAAPVIAPATSRKSPGKTEYDARPSSAPPRASRPGNPSAANSRPGSSSRPGAPARPRTGPSRATGRPKPR